MKIQNLTKQSLAEAFRDAIFDAANPPLLSEPAILASRRGFVYASKESLLGPVAIDLEGGLDRFGISDPVKEVSEGSGNVMNVAYGIARAFYDDALKNLEQIEPQVQTPNFD